MKKSKKIDRIKLLITLISSFIVVSVFSPVFFLYDSPTVNTAFLNSLQQTPWRVVAFIKHPLDPQKQQTETIYSQIGKPDNIPEDLNYTPLNNGVYAAETEGTGTKYIKIEKGTHVFVQTVTLNDGRQVKILTPTSK